jgi:hypothetical protein
MGMSDEISELTRKIAELEAKAAPKDASQPPRPGGVQAAKRAFAFIVVLAIIAFAALSNANRNSPGRSTVAAQPADKVITDLRPPASPASTAPGFATTKWYTPEPPARLRVTNWSCQLRARLPDHGGRSLEYFPGKYEGHTGRSILLTEAGDFVSSDDALIEYNPLLAGQTSPFKTITKGNPAIKRCKIGFKHFWGAEISFEDAKPR